MVFIVHILYVYFFFFSNIYQGKERPAKTKWKARKTPRSVSLCGVGLRAVFVNF